MYPCIYLSIYVFPDTGNQQLQILTLSLTSVVTRLQPHVDHIKGAKPTKKKVRPCAGHAHSLKENQEEQKICAF